MARLSRSICGEKNLRFMKRLQINLEITKVKFEDGKVAGNNTDIYDSIGCFSGMFKCFQLCFQRSAYIVA